MKKTLDIIFKVLFYLMTVVNSIGFIAYIVYMANTNIVANAKFFILFGVLFAVNITANVFICKNLIKSGIIKKRTKTSAPDMISTSDKISDSIMPNT